MEDADAYDETVAAVYQRGYRMAGRVIREAMVQVTYGGPKRPAPEPEPDAAADATSSDAADEA
jgi:molecular chaperone GrpE